MVSRRRLAATLRSLRIDVGMSVQEAAGQLLASPSKITRIERGQRNATLRDVRDLCVAYGASSEVQDYLMELARRSRVRAWWQGAGLDAALETLIGLEGAARKISEYEVVALPGLLQTRQYADAILGVWISEDERRKNSAVEVRMKRQQILAGSTPPEFLVVLDEAAIRRVVGDARVMKDQLEHLANMVEKSVADIRVIPFERGAHLGVVNGFTILEFEDSESEIDSGSRGAVYLERLDSTAYLDDPQDVEWHLGVFEQLREQAYTAEETLVLLRSAALAL